MTDIKVPFYRWAATETAQEVAADYPLVRRIARSQGSPANPSEFFLGLVRSMTQDQREILARALVKRFNAKALALVGESLSAAEQRALEGFQNAQKLAGITRAMPGENFKSATRKRVLLVLGEALAPVLGTPESDASLLRFSTMFGPWHVLTTVDLGAPHCALKYSHSLFRSESRERVAGNISCLMWLGIDVQTEWAVIAEDRVDEIAGTLVQLCQHFLRPLPEWLRG
jgi:hypothetical protein